MPFSSLLFSTTSRNSVNSFCSNGVLSPCKYNKFRQSVRLLYICKSTSYYVFQSFSIQSILSQLHTAALLCFP
jgi:hypothetical protein